MAKRFTDTTKWNEDWFLDLTNPHKLFWNYICDNCCHAGIFKPNKRMFELLVGVKIDTDQFLSDVNKDKHRVLVLSNGRWYLTGFILFQYGTKLNDKNRVHKSILEILLKNDIVWEDKEVQLSIESDTTKSTDKSPTNKATPQSIEEAVAFFIEKGSTKREGEKFYNFYGSKGWKVGTSPMKNWRLAATNWIGRNTQAQPSSDYLGSQLKQMKS